MKVFVYEHITALGIGCDPASAEHSLFLEGRAMRDALVGDFAAIPGVEILTGEYREFDELCARADAAVVIAPETDGELLALFQRVSLLGTRWLGCTAEAIQLTTDKLALAEHWRNHDLPTPPTWLAREYRGPYPAVVKLRDGCGSQGTRLVDSFAENLGENWIMQPWMPGLAVSVSFLIGSGQTIACPPVLQILDDSFTYLGGELPLPPELSSRAVALARRGVECVPGLAGWVGVDLILGESQDWLIEINPRLTTSYAGLRAMAKTNLAAALLELHANRMANVEWHTHRKVCFDASGETRAGDA